MRHAAVGNEGRFIQSLSLPELPPSGVHGLSETERKKIALYSTILHPVILPTLIALELCERLEILFLFVEFQARILL